jgi:hypothetical protein
MRLESRCMSLRQHPLVLLSLLVTLGCGGEPGIHPASDPPPYAPARTDYGRVNKAWVYDRGTLLVASPGYILVAADLSLPEPEDGRFDLDDIDIFDADTGENFGSDPHLERLTYDGAFIAHDDPEVAGQRDYRGVFVWQVPASVKRVNFGYWGEMLYVNPSTLESDDRVLPEKGVSVEAFGRAGRSSDRYAEYHVILEARNWFRSHSPEHYTLTTKRSRPGQRSLCGCDRWIEIDENGSPIAQPLSSRPPLIESRRFLVAFWCPTSVEPDLLNMFGSTSELPQRAAFTFPADAVRHLDSAPPLQYALHRIADE